jgi:hypothetical protein
VHLVWCPIRVELQLDKSRGDHRRWDGWRWLGSLDGAAHTPRASFFYARGSPVRRRRWRCRARGPLVAPHLRAVQPLSVQQVAVVKRQRVAMLEGQRWQSTTAPLHVGDFRVGDAPPRWRPTSPSALRSMEWRFSIVSDELRASPKAPCSQW